MLLCSLRYCLKCYFLNGVYSFTLSTVLYKHKSLYLKHWFDNDITLVDQLFNIKVLFLLTVNFGTLYRALD